MKTDQKNLKFHLEQKIGTAMQQQWAAKIFGYDFSIEYKSGSSSTVADALSRRVEEGELLAISFPIS